MASNNRRSAEGEANQPSAQRPCIQASLPTPSAEEVIASASAQAFQRAAHAQKKNKKGNVIAGWTAGWVDTLDRRELRDWLVTCGQPETEWDSESSTGLKKRLKGIVKNTRAHKMGPQARRLHFYTPLSRKLMRKRTRC